MSIVLHVTCDAAECTRHFYAAAGPDLRPRAGLGIGDREAVVFGEPYVLLPDGWTASGPDGAGLVYCRDHAGEAPPL